MDLKKQRKKIPLEIRDVMSFQFYSSYIQFMDQPTVIPVHHVTRFSHAHHGMIDCWLYVAHYGDDTLLGTMDDYMVPSLTYTPF